MSGRKQTILIGAIFIIGLLVMCYPALSNWYNELVGSYSITEYEEVVSDNMTEEKYEEMLAEAKAFNATVTGQPEGFEKGEAKEQAYQNALNVLDGMMGYLIIDKIDFKLPIYHGTLESTLQKAVGHLEGSHLPTGEIGNSTVLTGHTGLPSAELFTRVSELEIGDTFQVSVLDQVFTYEVFEINVVLPIELESLKPREDIDMVTLVTCTPYGVNSHRLMVHGKQIETDEVDEAEEITLNTEPNTAQEVEQWDTSDIMLMVIGILVCLAFIIMMLLLWNIRRKKRNKKDSSTEENQS